MSRSSGGGAPGWRFQSFAPLHRALSLKLILQMAPAWPADPTFASLTQVKFIFITKRNRKRVLNAMLLIYTRCQHLRFLCSEGHCSELREHRVGGHLQTNHLHPLPEFPCGSLLSKQGVLFSAGEFSCARLQQPNKSVQRWQTAGSSVRVDAQSWGRQPWQPRSKSQVDLWVLGWPGLHSRTLFQNKATNNNRLVISGTFLILAEQLYYQQCLLSCLSSLEPGTSLHRRSGCISVHPRRICLRNWDNSVSIAATGLWWGKWSRARRKWWDKCTKPWIGWHWIPHQQVLCGKHIKSISANKEFNLLLEIEHHYDQELGQK